MSWSLWDWSLSSITTTPVGLAVNRSFPGLHVGILLTVAALGFDAAVWVFQRRDIAA